MNTMKKCSTCQTLYEGELCPKCMAGFAQKPSGPGEPPEELPLQPGKVFHGLEIIELLGRGGMGVVYKARQPALDRLVALKILPRKMALDPDFQGRFVREAKALGALSHPNIVAVHDFGAEGDLFFFVMEFIDGVNLRKVLRDRQFTPEQAFKIVPQLCDALEYAHGEGVIHRDIKPENILIDKKGRVKIADFGLAKLVGNQPQAMLTQTNMVMGTPHYMAPEQVENPKSVDHRADIYSMGVVIYEMLTGELPIGHFELPSKKVQVDVRLDEVVLKALEKDPSRRYQSAGQVKEDVTRATTIDSYKPTVITPKPEARKRFPLALALGIAAGLALLVILLPLAYFFTRSAPSETAPLPPPPSARAPEPVDLSRLYFGPEERPGGYVYADTRGGVLTRNPFPAKEPPEIDALIQYLDRIGLQNVARSDIKSGYAAIWFRGEAAFVALTTPIAERLEREFSSLKNIENRWTHRRGEFLALAWSPRREGRSIFVDLVSRLQKKLGLPPETPEIPFENLVFDKDDAPNHWTLRERDAAPPPGGQARKCTFEHEEGGGTIDLEVRRFAKVAEADVADKEFRGDPSWHDVLRSDRCLVALRFKGNVVGTYVRIRSKLRLWLGLPSTAFETLVLTAAEIPAGYSLAQVVNDKAAVLKEAGLTQAQPSDVARAWRATFKPHGAITLLEIPDDGVRNKVREQLKEKGAGWDSDPWVFGVEGPDDETLDALENRMREKFGWDPNRPRPVHMLHARLRPEDLPQGWTMADETIDRRVFTCKLKGSLGTIEVGVSEGRDYGDLESLKEKAPFVPGTAVLVKDMVLAVVHGPEAAWPVVDVLEATLRKKMRMGPPMIEDVTIATLQLPKGSTYLQRGPGGNPRLARNPYPEAIESWQAVVDPSETEIYLFHLKDEKVVPEAVAKLAGGEGAGFSAQYRKGPFLAVLRQPAKKDEAAFKALCETVRSGFRLPK